MVQINNRKTLTSGTKPTDVSFWAAILRILEQRFTQKNTSLVLIPSFIRSMALITYCLMLPISCCPQHVLEEARREGMPTPGSPQTYTSTICSDVYLCGVGWCWWKYARKSPLPAHACAPFSCPLEDSLH